MPPAIKIVGLLLIISLNFTNGDYSNVLSSIYNKANQNRKPLVLVLDNNNRKGSKNYYHSFSNDNRKPTGWNDYRKPNAWSKSRNQYESSESRSSWNSYFSGSNNQRDSNDYHRQWDSRESRVNGYNRPNVLSNDRKPRNYNDESYSRPDRVSYDRKPQNYNDKRPRVSNNRQSQSSSNYQLYPSNIKEDTSSVISYLEELAQRLDRQKMLRKRSRGRGKKHSRHPKRSHHNRNRYGRSRPDSREDRFNHNNFHDYHDLNGNHLQQSYNNKYQNYAPKTDSRENNHNQAHYHDPHYHDRHNGIVSHNKNGDHVVHHHYDSIEKHQDNRYENTFGHSHEKSQQVVHYLVPNNEHSHVSYYRQGNLWQDGSSKDLTRTKPKKVRSNVVKSLLRISNDIQCDAKEECEDDCGKEEAEASGCEDECQQNFDCQEEREVDECEKDECAESTETTDNPSTRGMVSAEIAETGCNGCGQ